jgi:hypothetical protein
MGTLARNLPVGRTSMPLVLKWSASACPELGTPAAMGKKFHTCSPISAEGGAAASAISGVVACNCCWLPLSVLTF